MQRFDVSNANRTVKDLIDRAIVQRTGSKRWEKAPLELPIVQVIVVGDLRPGIARRVYQPAAPP